MRVDPAVAKVAKQATNKEHVVHKQADTETKVRLSWLVDWRVWALMLCVDPPTVQAAMQGAPADNKSKPFQCAGPGCRATCQEEGGKDWKGCDHCELWFCPKPGCHQCLLGHQRHCRE